MRVVEKCVCVCVHMSERVVCVCVCECERVNLMNSVVPFIEKLKRVLSYLVF